MPASSSSSMLYASRLSPMEKRGNFWRSSTSTRCPRRASSAAASDPAGPAPMTNTSACESFKARGAWVIACASGRAQRNQYHRVAAADLEDQCTAALGGVAQFLEVRDRHAIRAFDAIAGAE